MTLKQIVVPALLLVIGLTGFCAARASAIPEGSPSPASVQDRGGRDMPPQEMQEIQRQGFRNGIEGARSDFENHRRPDVNNRDEYRNPRLPHEQREAYQDGYRRGYEQGASHYAGGRQQPGGYPQPGYPQPDVQYSPQMRDPYRDGQDMGQGPGSEIQRRGFQDGFEGARSDLQTHRRPNATNRDEYRHPEVPRQLRNEYRDAFRRGYDRAMSQQQMNGHRDGDDDRERR